MQTIAVEEDLLIGPDETSSVQSKVEENDKLNINKRSETLQKLGTLSPSSEVIKSTTLVFIVTFLLITQSGNQV